MKRIGKQLGYLVIATLALVGARPAHADSVTDWNAIMQATVSAPPTNPFFQARWSAIVQLAVFEAVNAIGGDVVVENGGTVSYGTTAGQLQDHIVDTANITINGGSFGSGAALGTHFLGEKYAWAIEARYLHISNAGLGDLNPGLNTFEVRLGIGSFHRGR